MVEFWFTRHLYFADKQIRSKKTTFQAIRICESQALNIKKAMGQNVLHPNNYKMEEY